VDHSTDLRDHPRRLTEAVSGLDLRGEAIEVAGDWNVV
jgi:hypothetical protein